MLIDWFTVAAQLLNFLVLVWLMKRYLYLPILAAIAAREKLIATQIADAAGRDNAARQLGADLERKNIAFDQQRAALLTDATTRAQAYNEDLMQQGKAAHTAQRTRNAAALVAEQRQLCTAVTLQARDELLSVIRLAFADLGDEVLEAAMLRSFMRQLALLDATGRARLTAALSTNSAGAQVNTSFSLGLAAQAALTEAVGVVGIDAQRLRFNVTSGLLCGIELMVDGWSLGCNLDRYLQGYAERSGVLLQSYTLEAA